MNTAAAFFQWSELDQTRFPEFRDRIIQTEAEGIIHECRSYPSYPRMQLSHTWARIWVPLERVLRKRRSVRTLGTQFPPQKSLSRILQFAHGVNADQSRGPVPSGGGLQALELYVVAFKQGLYHYDRAGHYLSQISNRAERAEWLKHVPSMGQFEGGSLLWVIVGDGQRVERKYGERGYRFLLLEAGHLMQNLSLLSTSLGYCTLPLGGFFEQEIANEFSLLSTDVVLYVAGFGSSVNLG